MADRVCGELRIRKDSSGEEIEEKDGALNNHCSTSWCEYGEPNGQDLSLEREGHVSLERASESGKASKRERARKSYKAVSTVTAEKRGRPSGFRIEIFEGSKQLILRLLCFCCNLVLKDPVQTEDGIRLCSDCADYIIKLPNHTCPQCQITIQKGGVIPDFAGRKEVCRLNVRCINKAIGCVWRGILGTLQEHLKACDYKSEPCELCSDLVVAKFMGEHLKKNCTHREVQCDYCTVTFKFYELDDHHKQMCPNFPLDCEACGTKVERTLMNEHKVKECKFTECIVCHEQLLREDYKKHVKQLAHEHFLTVAEHVCDLKKEVKELREEKSVVAIPDASLMETIKGLVCRLEKVEKFKDKMEALQRENAQLKDRVYTLESSSALYRNTGTVALPGSQTGVKAGVVPYNMAALESPMSLSSGLTSIDGLDSRVTTLEHLVKVLAEKETNNNNRISFLEKSFGEWKQSGSGQHPNKGPPAIMAGDMAPLGQQEQSQHIGKRVGELEQEVTSLTSRFTELELQLQASLVSTYNGEFLWRIPDVCRRVRDAKTGKVTSIYSPPFFSGRMGYKMCVRAYLNGDGIGERTHLSLFFVLMRGEFDPLLSWPFKSTITLTLINQDNRSGDVREVFRTNPKSRSFQQPTSEMNVASGCPKFAGLEYLNNPSYVKQDVLYIRCTVDTSTLIHP